MALDTAINAGIDQNPELMKAMVSKIFGQSTQPGATPPFFGKTVPALTVPAAPGAAPAAAGPPSAPTTPMTAPQPPVAAAGPQPPKPGTFSSAMNSGTAPEPGNQPPPQGSTPSVLSEDEWNKQHPAAPHTPYQPPDFKHRLLAGIFAGMQEFGHKGEGAATAQRYEENVQSQVDREKAYPQTQAAEQHAGYEKYIQGVKAPIELGDLRAQVKEREAKAQKDTDTNALTREYSNAVRENRPEDAQRYADAIGELRGELKPDKTHTPYGDWRDQNPNAPVKDWLKTEQEAKPVPGDTSKVNPIVEAQIGSAPDPKSYAKGAQDPQYVKDRAAWGAKAEEVTNRMAAAGQNARGAAFGRNKPVQVIDTWNGNRPVTVSAAEAEDNPERYNSQGAGIHALAEERQYEDIRQGIGEVRKYADVLDTGFTNKAQVATALAQPAGTFGQWLIGEVGRGGLTEAQASYVTALQSLMERTMAIRGIMKGGQGEDLRRAILTAIPGPGTPSKGFAEKQLKQLESVVANLERGTPDVPLKPGKPEANAPAPSANPPKTAEDYLKSKGQ